MRRVMLRMAAILDARGMYELADRMERLAEGDLPDIDRPAPYAPERDPDSGPGHEEMFMRHYPTYRDAIPGAARFIHTIRSRIVNHLKKHPDDMQARVQLHAIDEYLERQGMPSPRAEIPEGEGIPDLSELARGLSSKIDVGPGEEPLDLGEMFSTKGISWGTSAPFAVTREPFVERTGYADINRVSIEITTPASSGDIVPIARQKVFHWLQEHGVDSPHQVVQFRPTVGTGRQRVFVDENPSSETQGRTKRGITYSVSFEINPPVEKNFVFDMSHGETWHDIARRRREEARRNATGGGQ